MEQRQSATKSRQKPADNRILMEKPPLPETDGEPEQKKKKRTRAETKKQLILSGMVLVLGLAVYLNWRFVADDPLTKEAAASASEKTGSSVRYYGEAELAGNDVAVTGEDAILAAARTARRQQEDAAKKELSAACVNTALTGDARKQAQAELTSLSACARSCKEMETRILAKGVSDCMVYYDGKSANVLVRCNAKALDSGLVTAIRDVVVSATKLPASVITIAEVTHGLSEESGSEKSGTAAKQKEQSGETASARNGEQTEDR